MRQRPYLPLQAQHSPQTAMPMQICRVSWRPNAAAAPHCKPSAAAAAGRGTSAWPPQASLCAPHGCRPSCTPAAAAVSVKSSLTLCPPASQCSHCTASACDCMYMMVSMNSAWGPAVTWSRKLLIEDWSADALQVPSQHSSHQQPQLLWRPAAGRVHCRGQGAAAARAAAGAVPGCARQPAVHRRQRQRLQPGGGSRGRAGETRV